MFGAWHKSLHPKFFQENEMLSYIQMGTFIVECISDVSKEGGQNQKKIERERVGEYDNVLLNSFYGHWLPSFYYRWLPLCVHAQRTQTVAECVGGELKKAQVKVLLADGRIFHDPNR